MSEDDIAELRARVEALPTLTTAERFGEMRVLIALIPSLLDEIERLTTVPDVVGSWGIPEDYTGWVA